MKYVVGDIHGEYDKLYHLIKIISKDAKEIIFLGDYINKGPKSKEVVEFLIKLSKKINCIFLMGNHEYAWIKYMEGNKKFLDFLLTYGGIQLIQSYYPNLKISEIPNFIKNKKDLKEILPKTHVSFISKLNLSYNLNSNFICIHAGINPDDRFESISDHNTEDLLFIRNKFLYSKFYYFNRIVIFGHTAFKEPFMDNYKIGIDTGATYPHLGKLTALDIDRMYFIQNTGKKFHVSHFLKNVIEKGIK